MGEKPGREARETGIIIPQKGEEAVFGRGGEGGEKGRPEKLVGWRYGTEI